ncbi:hypothetical protein B0T26DRAFT_738676 [Lasiosphaeria miniovina]|uniref:BZIP domain-containing protein n=1 Tax=Lasiosphaeria miniovina TaxID=1954250 RepID=A0AA40E5X8_9PEZI|nr:uncharacterized protein B0T26DRAFT_738676 [Lasiosphaeria miniovina]KAK0728270.1 hypothetical protein B0T26DRAFT_738676 [Lasiosphaeria miniovina]
MDTPSHFFNDCIDFEDPISYHSPEHDAAVDRGGAMHSFQPCNGKIGLDSSPTSAGDRGLDSRPCAWDDFAEHMGAMPADHRPMFVDPGLYGGESENEDMQMQALSMDMSRPSTRRTSSSKSSSQRTTKSASVSADTTPPDQGPPKKNKSRKAKKEVGMEDEHKRNKFLERNRVAASKCREKKKKFVSSLEENKIGLEAQHAQLLIEYNDLDSEVKGLKYHLMAHAKCNDPNIDQWLNNEARRIVQTSNEPFGPSFANANFGQASQSGISTSSPSSRNPSIASAYQALQGVQFDSIGPGERQGSMAYTNGPSFYTPPTDGGFPSLSSPTFKREPGINYDHMPDAMFSPEHSTFGG